MLIESGGENIPEDIERLVESWLIPIRQENLEGHWWGRVILCGQGHGVGLVPASGSSAVESGGSDGGEARGLCTVHGRRRTLCPYALGAIVLETHE